MIKVEGISVSYLEEVVRVEGLEPPRLAAPEPKSGASTNFATPACKIQKYLECPYQKDIEDSRAKTNFFKKKFWGEYL